MQEEAPALHSFADGRPTGPDPRDIIAALVGSGAKLGYYRLLQLRFANLFIFDLQHHHYVTALINHVQDAGAIIHQYSTMVDDLRAKELKKRGASSIITKTKARAAKLTSQLEDAEHRLASLAKQLKKVQGHNHAMENELLWLTQELDTIKACSLELS
ncbi:hypothetical protein C4D60_Mb06t18540 [Musa balbisiana]|uniref:Uncharacterized protein n=1 Tax=Musa balbisiana TaxID=52838 RepID=A0A4S8IP51_MUSBA|nr:hypothetical protein C4D60_Mb06t18540 [Musa balbisiana]